LVETLQNLHRVRSERQISGLYHAAEPVLNEI